MKPFSQSVPAAIRSIAAVAVVLLVGGVALGQEHKRGVPASNPPATLEGLAHQEGVTRGLLDKQVSATNRLSKAESDLSSAVTSLKSKVEELGPKPKPDTSSSASSWAGAVVSLFAALVSWLVARWTYRNQISWDSKKLRYSVFVAEQNRRLEILRSLPVIIERAQIAASTYLAEAQGVSTFKKNRWPNPEDQVDRSKKARNAYLMRASEIEESAKPYGFIPMSVAGEERDFGEWIRKKLYEVYELLQAHGSEEPGQGDKAANQSRQARFQELKSFVDSVRVAEETELLNRKPDEKDLTPFR